MMQRQTGLQASVITILGWTFTSSDSNWDDLKN